MKHFNFKAVALLTLVSCGVNGSAQEPVLNFNGSLYFVPGAMTKDGEAFMVSVRNSERFTIYDGDFNVVRDFTDPTMGQPYQERVVTMTRVCDPGAGNGNVTRAADEDWTVIDDQTYDQTTSSNVSSFELYSDDNNYHSRWLYVTQTLFDDDEEFEYLRQRKTIVPVSIKYSDYAKEHPTGGSGIGSSISWGDATIDSIMHANGADSFDWFWDDETGKRLMRLYKHEHYGGIFSEGMEIVTLDGTVKAYLPDISYISSAYYFRGKCYVEGYSSSDNSSVLYLLGKETTGIRELSRTKAGLSVRKVGDNLVFDSDSDGQLTLVMAAMDGRVVRSLTARQGGNQVSLNGLMNGVYSVTLYQQSKPVKSTKIIIKN